MSPFTSQLSKSLHNYYSTLKRSAKSRTFSTEVYVFQLACGRSGIHACGLHTSDKCHVHRGRSCSSDGPYKQGSTSVAQQTIAVCNNIMFQLNKWPADTAEVCREKRELSHVLNVAYARCSFPFQRQLYYWVCDANFVTWWQENWELNLWSL